LAKFPGFARKYTVVLDYMVSEAKSGDFTHHGGIL
jgi:hypothetical protein